MKLTSIILFIYAALLSGVSYSAIRYSGVLNTQGTEFLIDLNGDSQDDARLAWEQVASGPGFGVGAFRATFVTNFNTSFIYTFHEDFPTFPGYCKPLDTFMSVNSTPPSEDLRWALNHNEAMLYNTGQIGEPTIYSGEWNDIGNAFLGVRLSFDDRYYYGYIQLNVDAQNNVTLVDYALETEPDTWIFCGATPSNNLATLSSSMVTSNQFHCRSEFLNAGSNYSVQSNTNLTSASDWSEIMLISTTASWTNLSFSIEDRDCGFFRLIEK